jgi:hypothetical protein
VGGDEPEPEPGTIFVFVVDDDITPKTAIDCTAGKA